MPSNTAILVDPDVRKVGIDLDAFVVALRALKTGRAMLVPGLARHPELLTGAVKSSGASSAVVVTAEFERPPIAELRMWGEAGGLAPLGVRVVALDILRAGRRRVERSTYAVRMVRAGAASFDGLGTAQAVRRSMGVSLTRRGLLSGRATTWVPVVAVDPSACLGTPRCGRCVSVCPAGALGIQDGIPGAPPALDASLCEACSACLDICPAGALSLDGHDPAPIAQQMRALLDGGDGSTAPSLVISCQNAAEPLHHLGERDGLPGWLVLELPCLGGVGSAWQMAALAAGAPSVQVLPCERCMDRGFLTKELSFTRRLLTAIGDSDAARRAGVLPTAVPKLRRAIQAASRLAALVEGTGTDLMPAPEALETPARAAAWAAGVLRDAAAGAGRDQQLRPQVIEGQGSPLGMLLAAEGCTACGVCARDCPTRALTLSAGTGSSDLVLDPSACTGCGVCAEACPEGVLDVVMGVDLDLLAEGRVPIARVTVATCPDCGETVPALPAAAHPTLLPAGLAARCPACRQAVLVASI